MKISLFRKLTCFYNVGFNKAEMRQTPAKVDLLEPCTLYLLYDSHINVIQLGHYSVGPNTPTEHTFPRKLRREIYHGITRWYDKWTNVMLKAKLFQFHESRVLYLRVFH